LRIAAKDIERWAETREAQGDLPRMIRRLAVQAGTVTEDTIGHQVAARTLETLLELFA
jgi:hypothetical protein